jgi:hypothetical protein
MFEAQHGARAHAPCPICRQHDIHNEDRLQGLAPLAIRGIGREGPATLISQGPAGQIRRGGRCDPDDAPVQGRAAFGGSCGNGAHAFLKTSDIIL